jgi:hypothetical protein
MSERTAEVIRAYGQAWLEPDAAARRALLETAWADDGVYQDPMGEARGREALVRHIGAFHSSAPGARIELTTGFSEHHGAVHFGWRMVAADGRVQVEGVDFGRLAPDGRLESVTGFFGDPPPLEG